MTLPDFLSKQNEGLTEQGFISKNLLTNKILKLYVYNYTKL